MTRWTAARALPLLALLALPVSAQEAPPPRPVVSELVTEGPLRQRSFAGQIEAEVSAVLAFQTLGRVATLPVAAGDRVAEGQVLATLDQVTLAEDVEAAQAALAGARASAQLAAQTLTRTQELSRRGVSAEAQLEAAQSARDTAAAQVLSAEAALAQAEDAARFGVLTAPMAGIVLSTAVTPGTVVSPGTPVLQLAGLTGREAVIDVPAEYLALLAADAEFTLRGHGDDQGPITGKLKLVEPTADPGTRSRRLRLTLGEIPAAYRLGSLITATLAGVPEGVVTLPATAVFGPAEAPQVWRVGEGRAVAAVPVVLGEPLGDRVVVTGGIAPGEEIVVKGVHSLTPGQIVGGRIE